MARRQNAIDRMSTPERRKAAQQSFEQSQLVLGQKAEFGVAFPEVESCLVTVEESGQGIQAWEKGHPRGHRNPGEYIDCHNPLCNGGFLIGSIIRDMVRNRETGKEDVAYCFGHETSPKGRRVYGRCKNSFQYKVTITYKPQ
jgi:hypothetical protein